MASEISTEDEIVSGTVSVLLPLALPRPYDYKVPAGVQVRPGSYVIVPLGPQEVIGVVWGEGTGEVGHNRLRPVTEVLDVPPMPEVLRRFVDWVAGYTVSPPGSVLRLAIRAPGALEAPRMRTAYRLGAARPSRMTPARARAVEVAEDGFARTVRELAEEAGVSDGVVRGLVDAGALLPVDLPTEASFPEPRPDMPGVALSPEQAEAAGLLRGHVEARRFAAVLLDGVTGSGKTEVYFEAVAAALSRG
ncbi:MAG: primosomal protein N', partial [Alphaproteobacteria bacterium HGW-Alphaproteobacteria-10]